MTDITCIVNTHKEGHLVFPTLKSVKRSILYAQELGLSVELLVILDRSDEDTIDIVTRETSTLGRAIKVDFGDLALSRNHGAKVSSGKYLSYVDADDLWCQTWLVDCFLLAEAHPSETVLHPEYNVYFGNGKEHVLQHVDSESDRFEKEFIYKMNYWTALSFAKRDTYLENPYKKNTIIDGFGYEDWTWNFETLERGIVHKIVPLTAHYIRRGKDEMSLLDLTNAYNAIPKILELYRERSTNVERSKVA